MPDQPSWLQRVTGIIQELEGPDSPPFLDRPAVERLFGLRRRQAIRLLSACGGYQVGRTFVVPRAAMLDYLALFVETGKVEFAAQRKERILELLNSARRRGESRKVVLQVEPTEMFRLPPGVALDRGVLHIEFDSPVQLLEKLYALGQAVSADYEAFENLAGAV